MSTAPNHFALPIDANVLSFVNTFVDHFIGEPPRWPPQVPPATIAHGVDPIQASDRFATFMRVLLASALQNEPTNCGDLGLGESIRAFLVSQQWPAPPLLITHYLPLSVRLYQISLIAERLMIAVHDRAKLGDGGGGVHGQWPPH